MRGAVLAWVAIASPGDVAKERDVVEDSIYRWNQSHSSDRGVVFLSLRWERDVVPVIGSGPAQAIINQEIIRRSDVLIGFFGSRVGTAALGSVSGTVSEIEEAQSNGVTPHVFFSTKAIPRHGFDPAQFAALESYRESLRSQGLLGEFGSREQLRDLVGRCLTSEADRLKDGSWSLGAKIALRFRAVRDSGARVVQLSMRNVGGSRVEGLVVSSLRCGGRDLFSPSLGRLMTIEPSHEATLSVTKAPPDEPLTVGFRVHDGALVVMDSMLVR